jgi:hypothetical protein
MWRCRHWPASTFPWRDLGTAFSATRERCDEMMLVMLGRACEAIRSLDTFGRIDREAA